MSDVRIIGRPLNSGSKVEPKRSLESVEDSRTLGVICGRPDDLHYELEPMLDLENEEV